MKLWLSLQLLLLLTCCDRGAYTQDQTQTLNLPPTKQQYHLHVHSTFRTDLVITSHTTWAQACLLTKV